MLSRCPTGDATLAESDGEHVRVVRSDSVSERIDPRITPAALASPAELDEPYLRQLSDYVHHREPGAGDVEHGKREPDGDGPLYVEFEKGDPRDPVNFTARRKWLIAGCAIFFTAISAANASTYNMGFPGMIKDLNCTQFQATIGLSMYTLGFAITPLVTASFSEEFGRQPLYVVSAIGFGLMHLMVALANNIHTVQIARFFSGAFGSTGSTMVGGSIADIFMPHERGLPMAMFSLAAIGCTGLGPVAAGWIEMNRHLGWRWIQWIHFIVTMVFAATLPFLMKETRSAVVLTRIAKRLRKKTGDSRYRARVEDERARLRTLIWISCTRPLYLMVTEPVVASFSLWVGFAWGVLYVLIESIGPIFRDLHHFNNGEVGVVFVTFFIGSLFGVLAQQYQEKLYRKHQPTRGPEARLYMAMVAGIVFTGALFIYAWCASASVHWISLCIAIVLVEFSSFTIYLAVFTYLADCYGTFASSALAGQSLSRNLFGMAFPLFTTQMYATLTYHWANTMFGLLALVMSPVPFLLFFKGPVLRARSKFAVSNLRKEG
ncbi:MFS general substrate transporter [Phanerochaete sordida]|uniref:MFS general substrate transporter n=1 Tax=Phanerochaete sordida TaxID=48140 RepID=A0A9P3LG27_9APHY|nr:MFS general substrate transporter [Phanerochaete sordida]